MRHRLDLRVWALLVVLATVLGCAPASDPVTRPAQNALGDDGGCVPPTVVEDGWADHLCEECDIQYAEWIPLPYDPYGGGDPGFGPGFGGGLSTTAATPVRTRRHFASPPTSRPSDPVKVDLGKDRTQEDLRKLNKEMETIRDKRATQTREYYEAHPEATEQTVFVGESAAAGGDAAGRVRAKKEGIVYFTLDTQVPWYRGRNHPGIWQQADVLSQAGLTSPRGIMDRKDGRIYTDAVFAVIAQKILESGGTVLPLVKPVIVDPTDTGWKVHIDGNATGNIGPLVPLSDPSAKVIVASGMRARTYSSQLDGWAVPAATRARWHGAGMLVSGAEVLDAPGLDAWKGSSVLFIGRSFATIDAHVAIEASTGNGAKVYMRGNEPPADLKSAKSYEDWLANKALQDTLVAGNEGDTDLQLTEVSDTGRTRVQVDFAKPRKAGEAFVADPAKRIIVDHVVECVGNNVERSPVVLDVVTRLGLTVPAAPADAQTWWAAREQALVEQRTGRFIGIVYNFNRTIDGFPQKMPPVIVTGSIAYMNPRFGRGGDWAAHFGAWDAKKEGLNTEDPPVGLSKTALMGSAIARDDYEILTPK